MATDKLGVLIFMVGGWVFVSILIGIFAIGDLSPIILENVDTNNPITIFTTGLSTIFKICTFGFPAINAFFVLITDFMIILTLITLYLLVRGD